MGIGPKTRKFKIEPLDYSIHEKKEDIYVKIRLPNHRKRQNNLEAISRFEIT